MAALILRVFACGRRWVSHLRMRPGAALESAPRPPRNFSSFPPGSWGEHYVFPFGEWWVLCPGCEGASGRICCANLHQSVDPLHCPTLGIYTRHLPCVAAFFGAPRGLFWGGRGRRFKSCHSDQERQLFGVAVFSLFSRGLRVFYGVFQGLSWHPFLGCKMSTYPGALFLTARKGQKPSVHFFIFNRGKEL